MPKMNPLTYDVAIVGARCAGAATAMLLARSGARVVVLDRDAAGSDIMSTHALMRAGVLQLEKWLLLRQVVASGAAPVRSTSFDYGGEVVEVEIRPAHGTDALYAPRRAILDRILADAAAGAGATVHHGTAAVDLVRNSTGRPGGLAVREPNGVVREIRASVVIGADGRRSWLARQVQARTVVEADHTTSVCYAYLRGLPNRGYEWFYAPGAAGGIIPTNGGQSAVFLALPPARTPLAPRAGDTGRFLAAVRKHLPSLGHALEGAQVESLPMLFAGARGYMRDPTGPGWALVGDAGYFKDPLTAHGITDALRDAEILTQAILSGRLEDYGAERDALSADFFRLTDRIASFDWSLDELKQLHLDLNRAMKPTQARVMSGFEVAA